MFRGAGAFEFPCERARVLMQLWARKVPRLFECPDLQCRSGQQTPLNSVDELANAPAVVELKRNRRGGSTEEEVFETILQHADQVLIPSDGPTQSFQPNLSIFRPTSILERTLRYDQVNLPAQFLSDPFVKVEVSPSLRNAAPSNSS